MARGRKQSREQVEMELRRVGLERDCLYQVLRDFVEMRRYTSIAPQYYHEFQGKQGGEGSFRATLHQLESASGGYILITWKPIGKPEQIHSVKHLDDWLSDTSEFLKHRRLDDREAEAYALLYYDVMREQRAELDKLKAKREGA